MRPLLIVCMLAVAMACQPSSDPRTAITTSPEASASDIPTPVSGTCRSIDASVEPIVASHRTRIVLLRPTDGKELCTLVTYAEKLETVLDVEMAPDGKTVYFSDGGLGHCGSVYAIPTSGGTIREIARGGYGPALNPDGDLLAYDRSYACGDRRNRIIVQDLRTGSEREWIGTHEGGYGSPVWGPDPRFLMVPRAGADASRYFLFDTRKTGALDGPDWPPQGEGSPTVGGVDLSNPGVSLSRGTVHPATGAVAFGVFYSDVSGSEPYPILEYDPERDQWRVLLEDAHPIDYDATGTQLLIWRTTGSERKLFRYSGGRTFVLGKGFSDASM